jgi:hypothetical protein
MGRVVAREADQMGVDCFWLGWRLVKVANRSIRLLMEQVAPAFK